MRNVVNRTSWWLAALTVSTFGGTALANPATGDEKPEFPPFAKVSEGFTEVPAPDGSFYRLFVHKKDGQVLAELPAGYAGQKHMIATAVPKGELFAGHQGRAMYVQWKRFDKRLALIAPNHEVRSTGDQASKDSVANHFVDRVVTDVPIVCMGPGGQPVIDLDDLLVSKASTFYGSAGSGLKKSLTSVAKSKVFPKNVEVAFAVPSRDGLMREFHYSISKLEGSPSYKPRKADDRVGYFTTTYRDLGKFQDDEVWVRYVNRWHIEKADPSLKLSPPKEPLTFYLEHTVPVRYRRFVKDGVLAWNKAYEKIGISDAIVVHYQDKTTGAHMDKDPEDARYNFIRWLSNDIGTAIGPSRAHPETGQILDADIVLTDGWIRHFWYQSNQILPQVAMEGFTPETLRWLDQKPDWDPRVRLASPADRDRQLVERQKRALLGDAAYELTLGDSALMSNSELQDTAHELGDPHMLCMASVGKSLDMAMAGVAFESLGLLLDDDEEKEGEEQEEKIDGIPVWFIGPMLADLVSHEVGHTLGLRHNFKSSSIYTFEEMNSPEIKGKKPFGGSVMDYMPMNLAIDEKGEIRGDLAMIDIGPYDHWAIEYGYGFGDTEKVLERVAEPHLLYQTDEDTSGTDPLARRYDMCKDPLAYCENAMDLARLSRERILDRFVKEGDSWAKARRGYQITLRSQTSAISIMANWLGGTQVFRDHKGDPNARTPLQVVPADQQRDALMFVLKNAMFDEAFGLTPELLSRMTVEKWWDGAGNPSADATWPIHDRIAGVQASALTMVMNPTTLRRVYDNELFVPADQDVLTLPELLETVNSAVWQEIGYGGSNSAFASTREASFSKSKKFTARRPMVSSLRRNLQREHLERLIDLAMEEGRTASQKSIALLARASLGSIHGSIEGYLDYDLDPYTRAHLADARTRIEKVLDASYTYGGNSSSGGLGGLLFFGQPEGK